MTQNPPKQVIDAAALDMLARLVRRLEQRCEVLRGMRNYEGEYDLCQRMLASAKRRLDSSKQEQS